MIDVSKQDLQFGLRMLRRDRSFSAIAITVLAIGICAVATQFSAIEAADNRPGAPKVAILSHGLWQNDFGGDPGVRGQAVRINGRLAKVFPETNKLYATGLIEPLIKTFSPRQLRGLRFTMLGFCVGVLGAVFGVAGTFWTNALLMRAMRGLQNPIPSCVVYRVDVAVIACVVAATALSALVSGLVPAFMASRADPAAVLKDSGRGNTSRAVGVLNRGLVVFQIVAT